MENPEIRSGPPALRHAGHPGIRRQIRRHERNDDGLGAGLPVLVASGRLGPHDGLPVSIVKITTLTEVEALARCYRCPM